MSVRITLGAKAISTSLVDILVGLGGGPIAGLVDTLVQIATGESLVPDQRGSVDKRLARLDEARAALSESLSALDDLQVEAEHSKAEYERTRAALESALASKQDAEHQLAEVRAIMAGEVTAFRLVAGVPNVRKERVIGLIIGIVGSIIFSLTLWLGQILLNHLGFIG